MSEDLLESCNVDRTHEVEIIEGGARPEHIEFLTRRRSGARVVHVFRRDHRQSMRRPESHCVGGHCRRRTSRGVAWSAAAPEVPPVLAPGPDDPIPEISTAVATRPRFAAPGPGRLPGSIGRRELRDTTDSAASTCSIAPRGPTWTG